MSPDRFEVAVERVRSSAEEHGAFALFVSYPEQIARTLAQLDLVLDACREAGVENIVAPRWLVMPYTPTPDPADLVWHVEPEHETGPRVVFGGGRPADHISVTRSQVERSREVLADLERQLEANLSRLPSDSLTLHEILSAQPGDRVFKDNCHLTGAGARLAAEALAEAIISRVGESW